MSWLFENYSQTSEKGKLKPIDLKLSAPLAYEKIMTFLNTYNVIELKGSKDYLDIYFTQFGFEYSITIGSNPDSTAFVNISVFGEYKRGRTRGRLKYFRQQLISYFKNYIVEKKN